MAVYDAYHARFRQIVLWFRRRIAVPIGNVDKPQSAEDDISGLLNVSDLLLPASTFKTKAYAGWGKLTIATTNV